MEYEAAKALKESWGEKPCDHPSFADKYLFGSKTGDFVCEQCGQFFTQRQKKQCSGNMSHPKLKKLIELNTVIKERLDTITKHKDLLTPLEERDSAISILDTYMNEQETLINLADTLIKEMGL